MSKYSKFHIGNLDMCPKLNGDFYEMYSVDYVNIGDHLMTCNDLY